MVGATTTRGAMKGSCAPEALIDGEAGDGSPGSQGGRCRGATPNKGYAQGAPMHFRRWSLQDHVGVVGAQGKAVDAVDGASLAAQARPVLARSARAGLRQLPPHPLCHPLSSSGCPDTLINLQAIRLSCPITPTGDSLD
eukprot:7786903-Alexandrium_andersonii.AAC.2